MLVHLLDRQRHHRRSRQRRRGLLAVAGVAALAGGALLLPRWLVPSSAERSRSPGDSTRAVLGPGGHTLEGEHPHVARADQHSSGEGALPDTSDVLPRRLGSGDRPLRTQVIGGGWPISLVRRVNEDPTVLTRLRAAGRGATQSLDDRGLLRALASVSGGRGMIIIEGQVSSLAEPAPGSL
jgi:hypothetical protein